MEPKLKTSQTPQFHIRIVFNIVLFVSGIGICFEFRISKFEFVLILHSNDIVSRERTVKAFEVKLAN
jgi:hypothetical protein